MKAIDRLTGMLDHLIHMTKPTSLTVFPNQLELLKKHKKIIDGKYRGLTLRVANEFGFSKEVKL